MNKANEDKEVWERYAKGVKRKKHGETPSKNALTINPTPSPRHPRGLSSEALAKEKNGDPEEISATKAAQNTNRLHGQDADRLFPVKGFQAERAGTKPSPPIVLDKKFERSLRQGTAEMEARLDLHGMRQQEAHDALTGFIETQAAHGKRLLLVITGKGRAGEAVLRTNLPRWCAASPLEKFVFTLRPAAPRHGGEGAWYVLLRKKTVAEKRKGRS